MPSPFPCSPAIYIYIICCYHIETRSNRLTAFNMVVTKVWNPFYATGLFLYPLETSNCLMFLFIKGDHWNEMG